MAATPTHLIPLGFQAPDFKLLNPTTGAIENILSHKGPNGLVVIFMCNHCPYVIHIADKLGEIARIYMKKGIGFVGISSNDSVKYPQDAPELMPEFARNHKIEFPYLFDETQEAALAYFAACTPDFSVFNGDGKCVYRGQFDASRPSLDTPVTGEDLCKALDAMLLYQEIISPQIPSIGCNIKWKPGNEPEYFVPKK